MIKDIFDGAAFASVITSVSGSSDSDATSFWDEGRGDYDTGGEVAGECGAIAATRDSLLPLDAVAPPTESSVGAASTSSWWLDMVVEMKDVYGGWWSFIG